MPNTPKTNPEELTPAAMAPAVPLPGLTLAPAGVPTADAMAAGSAPVAAAAGQERATAPPLQRRDRLKAAAEAQRKRIWPDVLDSALWQVGAKKRRNFSQVPRTLPLLMTVINDASKRVGKGRAVPAGRAYLVLWCRDWGDAFIKIDNDVIAAAEAGYLGERAVSTWREHMKVLAELGFIKIAPGHAGPMQHVLLLDPYRAVEELNAKGWVQQATYYAVMHKATDVAHAEGDSAGGAV